MLWSSKGRKVGNFSQTLITYSSIEKHSVLYVDHPTDHFYEPLVMDYFDGLLCSWSSNKKVQQTFLYCHFFIFYDIQMKNQNLSYFTEILFGGKTERIMTKMK